VLAGDSLGGGPPRGREGNITVGLVVDELLLGQGPERPGNGGLGDLERVGNVLAPRDLVGGGEVEYRLATSR